MQTGPSLNTELIPEDVVEFVPQKLRILLIEDDSEDARLLTFMAGKIERYDIAVKLARTVDEARQAIGDETFDIFICDFWLGAETIVPFVSELASHNNQTPIIVISGLDHDEVQRLGLRAGAICFLPKADISYETLEATIASVLRMKVVGDRLHHDAETARGEKVTAIRHVGDWLKTILNRVDRIHAAASLLAAKTGATGSSELSEMARHVIDDAGSVRTELFERILRMQRLDPDDKKHVATKVDVVAVIASAVELLKYESERHRQRLFFSRPVSPVWVEHDQYMITDAFENVVRHAINASAVGAEIDIRLTLEGGQALVLIQSTPPKAAGAVGRSGPDYDRELQISELKLEPGNTFGLVAASLILEEIGGTVTLEQQSSGGLIVRARVSATGLE